MGQANTRKRRASFRAADRGIPLICGMQQGQTEDQSCQWACYMQGPLGSSTVSKHISPKNMKKAAGDAELCSRCGGRNPASRCGYCRRVKHYSTPCQHSNWPARKPKCLAPVQRAQEAAQAAARPRAPLAAEGDDCARYLYSLSPIISTGLPCGQIFHPA